MKGMKYGVMTPTHNTCSADTSQFSGKILSPTHCPSVPSMPRVKNRNRCHESTSRTTGRKSRPGRR